MIKYSVYNLKGEKVKDIELPGEIFGVEANDALLHQVFVSQEANARRVIAHTKDRAQRAGSGKKPWKQKGTGRARVGSVRSPIWRKGGVVFGPTKDRNFGKTVPKKMGRKATLTALSEKVRSKQLVVIESLRLEEVRTKMMASVLRNLKLKGTVLAAFALDEKKFMRAGRNIPFLGIINVGELNVQELLKKKNLILSLDGIKELEAKYLKKAELLKV